jgi:surfeit locus 1 family protein
MSANHPSPAPKAAWRTAQWWFVTVVALMAMAVTARLGVWQSDRAQQKESLHNLQQAQALLAPLTNAAFESPMDAAQGLHRRVSLQGVWRPEHTVFLQNRSQNGAPGFWVLTPLQLSPTAMVLVQRGWAPRDRVSPEVLPPIETPPGQVNLQGRWIAPPSRMVELTSAAESSAMGSAPRSSVIRQNLDVNAWAAEMKLPILATVLQTGTASEGLARDWAPALSGADKNRGYAFQWFALSGLVAVLFVWFQIILVLRHVPPTRS